MKRNIIKLQKGSYTVEKQTVRKKDQAEKDKMFMNKLLSESLSLGMSIVVPIAGGTLLGVFLDKLLHTTPKLTIALMLFGVFAGFYKMYTLIKTGETTE
jgi:F0F1-type ATP synthase assembly protein I